MKKLKRFISWTIWSLLCLYVLLMVLVHLPPVQRWIGSVVSGAAADFLGTEVSVGRVDMGFLNRLIIDDVSIRDQRNEPMLCANRVAVKMELLPLLSGRVSISSAQLFGVSVQLYRDSAEAVPNYQFALDALSSEKQEEPSSLDLRIGSLIVRRLSLSYDQRDAPQTPGRLNLRHLNVNDVSAHVLLRQLTNDSLHVDVKRMALHEQSGLAISRLSFCAEANRQRALLSNFMLQLPHSALSIDTLRATYHADSLLPTLRYQTTLNPSTVALSDLQSVLPPQVPTHHTLTLEASLSGSMHSANCPQLRLGTTDEQLIVEAAATADSTGWQVNLEQLNVGSSLLSELHEKGLAVPTALTRIGDISLTGKAISSTLGGSIAADAQLHSSIGNMTMQGTTSTDLQQWNAHIDTDSLDMHQLFDAHEWGLLAAHLDLTGHSHAINIRGEVPFIEFKGYRYTALSIDGSYHANGVEGKLHINDPHLQADVEGLYDASPATPRYRLTGIISSLAPKELHLSDRWGDATFAAIVDADFTATSIADIQGTIDLDDFILVEGDSTHYQLDNLHVRSGFSDDRHFLRMTSDFGEAQLNGHFDLTTLPASFSRILHTTGLLADAEPTADNDFTLNMRLTDSKWMQQLAGLPIQLNGPLSLDAQVADQQQVMEISASIPSFSVADNDFRMAALQLSSTGDSAHCRLNAIRLTSQGTQQTIKLNAQAADKQLFSSLDFNAGEQEHATVNTIASFYTNEQQEREIHVRVLPSELLVKGANWQLEPCDVVYNEKRLMVDHFLLHCNDEHLLIDGMASSLPTDTLMLELKGVNVDYVLDLVNFHSVKFGGHASGKAFVCHAFSTPVVWANIDVDDFLFLDAPMGRLEARAEWNNDEGQVDLEAAIDAGADAQTYVDGFISLKKQELDLGILARGTSLAFIHSFTRSFISQMEGQAWGEVRVAGPLKSIDLTGEAIVNGQASITPLGTTYSFSNDTVRLTPGQIEMRQFHVADRYDNTALLNGTINHQKLKNFTFSFQGQAENLLAYDFPRPETGNIVGGTVWATGTALIDGKPGEVLIDCDFTTAPGSIFYYNAANPDAVSRHQFITWGERNDASEESQGQQGRATVHRDVQIASHAPMSSTSSDVRLNLRINAQPQATLYIIMDQNSDDHITLGGTGTLRATFYNKGAFQLFGTYDVERGIYSMTIQNLLRKNFQFQPGSTITFGGDPLQAALSLKAQHPVSGVSLSDLGLGSSFTSNTIRVNCLMNIGGTAGEPRVDFDLEMPTVNSEEEQMIRSIMATEQEINQQVVYLLGIGRFYTQGANNAATQTYGQTELAMQSLLSGTVSSQINTLLSQVIKTDDWNFGANISTGNEGWHNAEYEGMVSGRMLNNRLLVNGQFGYRDNATQATPSFIGDFDISYLLTPGGSVALKAYNQTNDRYFTHSSLNTQGIGLILKKDFNGLGDLFSHKKRRKN